MQTLLPVFKDYEEYDQTQHREQTYQPAIEEIGRRHALPHPVALRKYPTGSLVVFAYGDEYAIKLYPPLQDHHFKNEISFYCYLEDKLKLETPAVVAQGQLEGWDYLVMTQLRDPLLDDVWSQIPQNNKSALLFELGRYMADLHELPAESLVHTCPDWQAYVHLQADRTEALQLRAGATSYWVRQIEPYLRKNIPLLPSNFKRSLLHTELCGNCLTAAFDGKSWHLTGMLDCADSFVGPAEYDFASVLLLLCKSDRTLRRAFFSGYGIEGKDLNGELENRIMTYTLLHRYCNLCWFMNVQPPRIETETLGDLATQWYGCCILE